MIHTSTYFSYDIITSVWKSEETSDITKYIHPFSTEVYVYIDKEAKIGKNVQLSPMVSIYKATIGDFCIIDSHTIIEDDVIIGECVRIDTHVHLWENVEIGDDVYIQEGVIVYGNTKINKRITISMGMQIGEDLIVTKDPVFIKGSKHSLYWYNDTKLRIGCNLLDIDEWLKCYKEYGETNHYTEKEIEEYLSYIKLLKTQGPPYIKKGE